MLSDAERRRPLEIESLLRVDDPAFVQQFDKSWDRRRGPGTLALLVLIVAAMVTVLAVLAGAVVVAVVGVIVSGAAVCVLEHRQR